MLTIRQPQFDALSKLEVQKFEDWTHDHLHTFFPAQCAALGERRLREVIRHGIHRAARYGITARRDVCKYIDLMIVFGREFDTNRQIRWAAPILAQRINSGTKMQSLLAAAKRSLRSR